MKLLIVESPAKAKTISKYLDGEYTVKASVGHIRDLPKSNKKAIDIEAGFVPHYEISPGKEKVVAELKTLANKSSEVLLATDPDREGEAIAWHIAEATGLKKPKRVVFHEITKDAVTEAVKHPRDIDDNLKTAQEARRVLDRLVGYDLSGLIWKKVRYGLSAGRVQSPALRIIMEREREIRNFNQETFWTINADLKGTKNVQFTVTCTEEPRDQKIVEDILTKAKKDTWEVIDIKESEVKRSARPPFITSTLQQSASSRLAYAPSKTMSIAQKLYEAGLITYMRTDSTNLSIVAQKQIESVVTKKFGKELYEPKVFAKKSKNAQEAHEAIRPTDFSKETAGNTDEQKRLYKLIWSRTVSSQMLDAKILRTKAITNNKTGIPDFIVNGSRIIFEGWIKADPHAKSDDVIIPEIKNGEKLQFVSVNSTEKQTEPPTRYSEAGLVKELEKRGIGRPSTYASIIKTIEDRGYVEKINKALHPTDTGDVVSTFLENNFMEYINDSFTAEMEDKLDDISNGKAEYVKTLKEFYTPFLKAVKSKEKIDKITSLGDAPKEFVCPICGSEMEIKLGKSGKFMSCKKFPECSGARTIEGKAMEGPKDTGKICPKCGVGKMMERESRFGKFIACSNYPKCKHIENSEAEAEARDTKVACPECKKGTMVERRGRFGIFYSCSNYPDCKNITKTKPTGALCSICGALMMEGTKTIPERCSKKTCPNHNPHKLQDK